jgi:hypothetical protein
MFPDLTPKTRPLSIPDKEESVSNTNTTELPDAKLLYYLECRMYWCPWHGSKTGFPLVLTLTRGKTLLWKLKFVTFRANGAWLSE